MTIGENIKKARKRAGLTQKQLGELSGMADSAIRRYESDRANPKIQTLEKIAKALNCSVNSLFPAIDDFKKEIENRIDTYNKQLTTCNNKKEAEKLRYKINLLKNEEWGVLLSNQTDEIYTVSTYFMDILSPYIRLNAFGQIEAVKRVEELTHIEKYTKED